jgi:hypothetical protein
MHKPLKEGQRRIHLQVQERQCPGLIRYLDRIPEGEVNAFIRNVLVHWFEVHEAQGNLDQAVSKILLYDALRIAREHLDAGSDIVGTYAKLNVLNDPQLKGSALPAPNASKPPKTTHQSPNIAPPSVTSLAPSRTPIPESEISGSQAKVTTDTEPDAFLFDPDDLLNGT